MKLKFYTIDARYTDYLREFDCKVPMEHTGQRYRPYIGIVLEIHQSLFFAPMSSPKKKHLNMHSLDIYKIQDGKLGIINFNNMIPVLDGCYHLLDIANEEEKYKFLLYNQSRDINRNHEKIGKIAKKLYSMYINNHLPEHIKSRCCDFLLLEEKSKDYQNAP